MFDPVINKNMLNMKLQQLARHKKRQESVLADLPELVNQINEAKSTVDVVEEKFKKHTNKVLKNRI